MADEQRRTQSNSTQRKLNPAKPMKPGPAYPGKVFDRQLYEAATNYRDELLNKTQSEDGEPLYDYDLQHLPWEERMQRQRVVSMAEPGESEPDEQEDMTQSKASQRQYNYGADANRRTEFYNALVGDGYRFGENKSRSRDEYDVVMRNPYKAAYLYSLLTNSGDWELDDFDTWYSDFGVDEAAPPQQPRGLLSRFIYRITPFENRSGKSAYQRWKDDPKTWWETATNFNPAIAENETASAAQERAEHNPLAAIIYRNFIGPYAKRMRKGRGSDSPVYYFNNRQYYKSGNKYHPLDELLNHGTTLYEREWRMR